jgi:hypothetical protein
MTYRGLLLSDGASDGPLARHLERIAADLGGDISLLWVDTRLANIGLTVAARMAFLVGLDANPDILFVHRDAEAQNPSWRFEEIASGATAAGVPWPVVPIVPIRMTEAWLLLDESAIRSVAGRPTGRAPLPLPTLREAERLADPKRRLMEVLLAASETSGRRGHQFKRDFDRHRALLIERLDTEGPVSRLSACNRTCRASVALTAAQLRIARITARLTAAQGSPKRTTSRLPTRGAEHGGVAAELE